MLASTKVLLFFLKTSIFSKYSCLCKFARFFNISQFTDFQRFAKKLQKRLKKKLKI